MKSSLAIVFSLFALVNGQCQTTSQLSWKFAPSMKDDKLDGFVIANGLTNPRSLRWANDTLLVVDSGVGIIGLTESTNGCKGWTKTTLVQNSEFNHGILVNGTQVYVSTVGEVFRYAWDPAARTLSSQVTIVNGMNLAQNHKTRSLEMSQGYLFVSAGASSNVEEEATDATHGTAEIRRFAMNSTIPSNGYDWLSGEVVAWGMRNAVGLATNPDRTTLWTVENSADELNYTVNSQLVDIHQDNPSEELNSVTLSDIGHYYGYPSCFTAWNTSVIPNTSLKTGDQFSIDSNVTDAQCGNTTFNKPPRLGMQAHSAPLDIAFYQAPSNATSVAVSTGYNTHAFVSFHGSWNRVPPTGYGVVRIPWSGSEPTSKADATDGYSFVMQAPDLTACPNGCIRPVGLAFDSRGRLFGASDATGEIFIIQASGNRSFATRRQSVPLWGWAAVGFGLLLASL